MPRPAKARRPAPKEKLKDMLGFGSLEAPLEAPRAPTEPLAPVAEAPAAPAPPEHSDLPMLDDAQAAQATEDFLRSSPVLGLQGKPVQRTSDDTGFSDPDAIAVATLAGDVGRYGVPDEAREVLRATLVELARQFEDKSPQWSSLQNAVTRSMEYPEVARRLMPIVLPWMHRAA
jgi:hypothetical protein